MALTTEVNLKLLLNAENNAQDVLDQLLTQTKEVSDGFKTMAEVDLAPLSDALGGLSDLAKVLAEDVDAASEALKSFLDVGGESEVLATINQQLGTLVKRTDAVQESLAALADEGGMSKLGDTLNQQLATATERADALKADLAAVADQGGLSKELEAINAQMTTATDRAEALKETLATVVDTPGTSAALTTMATDATDVEDRLAAVRASLLSVLDQAGASKALEDMNAQLTTVLARIDADRAGLDAVLQVAGDSPALTDVMDQLNTAADKTTALADQLDTLKGLSGESPLLAEMQAQITELATEAQALRVSLSGEGVGGSGLIHTALGGSSGTTAAAMNTAGLTELDRAMASVDMEASALGATFTRDAESLATIQSALEAATVDTQTFWDRVQGWAIQAQTAVSDLVAKTDMLTTSVDTMNTAGAAGGESIMGKTMMVGMNAMMAMYGMQALGNAAGQFSTLQQMQLAMKSTPSQAAQMMMMLGTGGITGSSAATFLTGLSANIQNALKPINGTMGREGVMLQSLGIGQAQANQSPQYLLRDIQQKYMQMVHQGLGGSSGAQLLSLTGTSQLAGVFAQWGSLQKQASSVHLGMNTQQVNAAAKQGLSLQMSLQQLSLAFDEMAVKLVPLLNPLVAGFTKLLGVIDQIAGSKTAHGIGQGLSGIFKEIGTLFSPGSLQFSKSGLGTPHLTTTKGSIDQWVADLQTMISHAFTHAGASLIGKPTGFQAVAHHWATQSLADLTQAFTTASKQTGPVLTRWATQALGDLTRAYAAIHKGTVAPMTQWAAKALADLTHAYATIQKSTLAPFTAWATKALGDLTQALTTSYANVVTPLNNWVNHLVSSLTAALANAVKLVGATISVVGRSMGLQLQAMIEGMLAYMENAGGNLAGALPLGVGHGIANSLHRTAGASAHQSSDAQLQAAIMTALMNHGLSAQMANRVGGSLQARHGQVVQNNTFQITGLVGNDRVMAKRVIDQIVTQLKLQGNFSF